jgi:hypothetical protein
VQAQLIGGDQPEQPVLLAGGNAGYVRGQRARIVLHLGQRRAGLGGDAERRTSARSAVVRGRSSARNS